MDDGLLFHLVAAETAGVDLDDDFSLAAGGDLSRKRDSGAASAGEDIFDGQIAAAAVFD
jgi:hypothetical protein